MAFRISRSLTIISFSNLRINNANCSFISCNSFESISCIIMVLYYMFDMFFNSSLIR